MVDEIKDQETPESPLDLKEFEHQEMLKVAAEINPQAPEDVLNIMTATTAVENILVGSSPPPGAVFHPNLPLARVTGAALEAINQVRRKINMNPRYFSIKVGDDLLLVWFNYLDLTKEHLNNNQLRTFGVVEVTDLRKNKVDAPGDLDKLIDDKISARREKEKQELISRLQGKISTDSS